MSTARFVQDIPLFLDEARLSKHGPSFTLLLRQLVSQAERSNKFSEQNLEKNVLALSKVLDHLQDPQPGKLNESNCIEKGGFFTLGALGILNNSLGGFNGMAAIASLFTTNIWIILPPAILFALINAVIFIGFDFSQAAKRLAIQTFSPPKKLSLLLKQKQLLMLLAKLAQQWMLSEKPEEHQNLSLLFTILDKQKNSFSESLAKWQTTYYLTPKAKTIKTLIGYACTILFLLCGYFNGQAGAMFLLSIPTIAVALSNPVTATIVILTGILSAVGAASFYFFLQRQGVESLASRMMGYDEQSIEILTNKDDLQFLETCITIGKRSFCQRHHSASLTSKNIHQLGSLSFFGASIKDARLCRSAVFEENSLPSHYSKHRRMSI